MLYRSVLFFALLSLFCVIAAAQPRFAGRVTEAIDGRTVLIESHTGKVVAQLQAIETPEAGEPFREDARIHLSMLVKGKMVEFRPIRLLDGRIIGTLYCSGVDVSLQMIRDGAAWHEPIKTSGQTGTEAFEYQKNEMLARDEKRGIWSVPHLKTPWEIRAEREAAVRREEERLRASRPAVVGVSQFQTSNRPVQGAPAPSTFRANDSEFDAWTEVFSGAGKESVGLGTYTDPQQRFGVIYTSADFIMLSLGDKKQKLECRAIYAYFNTPDGRRETLYLLGFQGVSAENNFSRRKSSLSVTIDKRRFQLGSPRGFTAETAVGVKEVFYYKLTKTLLNKIANGRNVEFRIDSFEGNPDVSIRELIKQLVEAT